MVSANTEVFSATEDQLGRLSLIEAIRANTDAVDRMARHSNMQDGKLDDINRALGEISTRLALLEHNRSDQDVKRLEGRLSATEKRVTALETDRNRREGALGLIEWIFKNWPGILGFVAMIVIVLVATGKVQL